MARTISIYLDEAPTKEEQEAINYFSSWSYTVYDLVEIYREKNMDLIAVFRETSTYKKYVIGAIWEEEKKRFTFHS